MAKSRKIKALITVAHPDDEVIFFAGLILSRKYDWTVACVTDGNADGRGAVRKKEFARSCKILGASRFLVLNFPDKFNRRLNVPQLTQSLSKLGPFDKVFTHGILGEYGHKHHQDVSFATHCAFKDMSDVYSVAYNTFPDFEVRLTKNQFRKKASVIWNIYGGESRRFLNLLPATFSEGFSKISIGEIRALYSFVSRGTVPKPNSLKTFRWLLPFLMSGRSGLSLRPF